MLANFSTQAYSGLVILTLVSSFFLVSWSCNAFEQVPNSKSQFMEFECKLPDPLERPKGDELRISAERLDTNRLRVRIRNVSNRKVYLPYSPSERETVYVSHLTEKRSKQGNFELQPSEADFVPGLHRLDEDSELQFNFFEVEKGEYRLILRYLVDGRLADLLNRPDCLTKLSKQQLPVELVYGRAISPVLKITARVPTPLY